MAKEIFHEFVAAVVDGVVGVGVAVGVGAVDGGGMEVDDYGIGVRESYCKVYQRLQ